MHERNTHVRIVNEKNFNSEAKLLERNVKISGRDRFPRGTEENHGKHQSIQPVSWPRFQPGASRIRSFNHSTTTLVFYAWYNGAVTGTVESFEPETAENKTPDLLSWVWQELE